MRRSGPGEGEFGRLIGRLVRRLSLLDRDQKVCCGITMAQCYTIEALARREGLAMNELSAEMGVTMSTMTRVVDVLVRDGVVRRGPNPDDRRRVSIELTARGRGLAKRLRGCSDDYSMQILKRIPSRERAGVLRALESLADAVEGVWAGSCQCGPRKS